MSDSPHYVTWHCQQCGGGIEFDANELASENNVVPCPHCGINVELHVPTENSIPETSEFSSVATNPTPYKHKRTRFTKGTRVALTPSQLGSAVGRELVDLLCDIVRDGLVSDEGVRRLNAWLDRRSDSDIPAIRFLLQISDRILRTGKVTTAKAFEMHFAIERVLPKDIRSAVKEKRQEAWLHSPLKPKATEAQLEYIRSLGGTPPLGINVSEASMLIDELIRNSTPPSQQPATEKQIGFIRELGGNIPEQLSKEDASVLIEHLLAKQRESLARQEPPTPRQVMVLRFWNRLDLAESSKWDVSQWLNHFYEEEPRRQQAWETFKKEIGDDGSQDDPSLVPLGAGEAYLEKC